MRVASISSSNYLPKTTKVSKQNENIHRETNLVKNDVNFKGKKWAVLQSLAWAGLGFIAAGPFGALLGAGVGAGVGSCLDDDEPAADDSSRPYNQ